MMINYVVNKVDLEDRKTRMLNKGSICLTELFARRLQSLHCAQNLLLVPSKRDAEPCEVAWPHLSHVWHCPVACLSEDFAVPIHLDSRQPLVHHGARSSIKC